MVKVIFNGWQEDGLGGGFPLYNVYGPGWNGTTVGVETLVEHGLQIPATPSYEDWQKSGVKN